MYFAPMLEDWRHFRSIYNRRHLLFGLYRALVDSDGGDSMYQSTLDLDTLPNRRTSRINRGRVLRTEEKTFD